MHQVVRFPRRRDGAWPAYPARPHAPARYLEHKLLSYAVALPEDIIYLLPDLLWRIKENSWALKKRTYSAVKPKCYALVQISSKNESSTSLNFWLLSSVLGDSHLNIFPCIRQLPIRRELEGELSSKRFASLHSFDLFAHTMVMCEGRGWKTWARVRSSHLMRTHPGEVRSERGRYLPFIFLLFCS